MPNVLIQPVSGAIYFDTATAGSSAPLLTNNYAFLSASNTGTLYLIGAGTNSERLRVIGTQGNLFSVIDALTGSLFSVNKIGGLPILEVLDTDTVRAGTYLSNTLLVSGTQVGLGGLPVTVNAFPHRLTVYGRSTFTDFLSTRLGTSDNWNSNYTTTNTNSARYESTYSTVCATSAFYISNTITASLCPNGYTFSDADNLRTYHVDTTTAAVSVIFPSTLSNNFSVTLITLGTNLMQVSSTQTPFLCANGSRVYLPFASTLIYKYNNLLWGLGSFT